MGKSFNFYLSSTDPFFKALGDIIVYADITNKAKLYSIFPSLVVASTLKSFDDIPGEEYEEITNIIPEKIIKYIPGDRKCNRGSFGWYLVNSGHFVTAMAKVILNSDAGNLALISKVFPQMVAAFKEPDWDMAPENFFKTYDSMCDMENVIPFKIKS